MLRRREGRPPPRLPPAAAPPTLPLPSHPPRSPAPPASPAGVELLSQRERELCAGCRLLPAHFLALKDTLLRDCCQNGAVTRQEARAYWK
jgi:hypothetical protein